MKSIQIVLCLLGLSFFIFSCSDAGNGNQKSNTPTAKNTSNQPGDDDLAAGKKLFKKWCIACHGITGDMEVNGAKDLGKSVLSLEERVEIISNGKGLMTPFSGLLLEEEILQLAKYVETFRND